MNDKLRILITGFGPFPGEPYNPTQALVKRLLRLRRPAFSDVELFGHIFPVTYTAVDRELPQALKKYRPQALLMFGLAGRTAHVRVETRARGYVGNGGTNVSGTIVPLATVNADNVPP